MEVNYNNHTTRELLLSKIQQTSPTYLPTFIYNKENLFIDIDTSALNSVSLKKLKEGKYLTKSRSDKDTVSFVSFVINNLPSFNKYKDNDNINYILNNNNDFMIELLYYSIFKPLSIVSFYKRIVSFLRILYIALDGNKNDDYRFYSNILKHLSLKIQEDNDKQELNKQEQETFVDFEIVLNKQKELLQKFNNNKTYKNNQDLLLISIYSLIPPNRKEITELIYITHIDDDDKVNDFIYIDKDNNDVKFILNKMKKRHQAIVIDITKENKDLADMIIESFDLFERPYLFTDYSDRNKIVNYSLIYARFRNIFKDIDKRISINSLRSSYLSYLYKQGGFTIAKKKEIANKMRTSTIIIDGNYVKMI